VGRSPERMRSFKTQDAFRKWLEKHHATEKELILRLYKVHARDKGIGHREALDEALCFGWIDGVVRSLDADSFSQRFTPRKAKSNWSAVNIKRVKELEAEGRMRPAGMAAFQARDTTKPAPYSFENRGVQLDPALETRFRKNKKAWTYWDNRPPGYKRTMTWMVMSGKKEDTRLRRLDMLIRHCEKGVPIPLNAKDRV